MHGEAGSRTLDQGVRLSFRGRVSDRDTLSGMQGEVRRITVSPDQAGARLDVLLSQVLSLSRSRVEQLLQSAAVRWDGRPLPRKAKGWRVEAGQVLEIASASLADTLVPQPELPLDVLAGGEGWIVVHKPAGQNVHPLQPGESGTLLHAAVARYPQMQGVGEGGLRSGVVHRLDVQTSGCLVLATHEDAWQRLRDAFAQHQTQKVYRALVSGAMSGSGREVVCLKITQHKPALVRVVPPAPDLWRCDLHWHAVEALGPTATLVEVTLGTGFLHQIRATFAHLGHPLLGDSLYGGPPLADRVMLHAASLRVAAVNLSANAPDPTDFAACLQRLRRTSPP
jgi:23S rRNA pseudouridine1911/1915/1917 synthase